MILHIQEHWLYICKRCSKEVRMSSEKETPIDWIRVAFPYWDASRKAYSTAYAELCPSCKVALATWFGEERKEGVKA